MGIGKGLVWVGNFRALNIVQSALNSSMLGKKTIGQACLNMLFYLLHGPLFLSIFLNILHEAWEPEDFRLFCCQFSSTMWPYLMVSCPTF